MWFKSIVLALLLVIVNKSLSKSFLRVKRQAYSLPAGANFLFEPLRTTFQCTKDGYYADVDNNCQVFHVCHARSPASNSFRQWSFLCGNQTVFSQLTLTCVSEEEALPCIYSDAFHYLNERVLTGEPGSNFLNEEDLQNAEDLRLSFQNPLSARQGQGSLTKP